MGKKWSDMTSEEREKEKERSRERMRRYRAEGRYDSEWARYHMEAREKLKGLDKEEICYNCHDPTKKVRAHHVDGDYTNNDDDNLEWCCHSCDSKMAWDRKISR